MAGGAKIAKNMLNFAAGLNESLRPVASKAGREALSCSTSTQFFSWSIWS